ncbi:MAG: hypothetical protein VX899_08135 [Myxococcota bacterium]|nr:hypothetical protein [Myxococcota bacterium]
MLWLATILGAQGAELAEARAAERAGDPERERAVCLELPDEPRCVERLEVLQARQDADGGLRGLATLEAARRGEEVDLEPLATGHTSPTLRAEAGLLLASRSTGEDSLRWTQPLWDLGAEHPLREQIGRAHALALAQAGRLDDAAQVEAQWAEDLSARPNEGVRIERLKHRQRVLGGLSGGLLALYLLGAAAPAFRGRRVLRRARGFVPMLAVGLLSALLAGLWDRHAGGSVLLCLPGWLALHAVSVAALSETRGWVRGGLRVGAGVTSLAVGFLVLWWRQDLGWLGL